MAPENRDAFECSRAVAAGRLSGPAPLVLFGPPGGGKSHLIWSILNEVRGSTLKAGIALVLARDFPERVRQLQQDPSPLRRGQPITLLVDELERFLDSTEELEAVVALFLAHGHPVVLSSDVHPARLTQFSDNFRTMLQSGQLVEVSPLGQAPAVEIEALHAEIEQVRAERDAKKFELEQATADQMRLKTENVALLGEIEALHAAQARAATLETSLAGAERRISVLEEDRARLEATINALEIARLELEQDQSVLQKQVAAQGALQQELLSLRRLFADAEGDAEAALAQQARLQGQLSAAKVRIDDLEREREASRQFIEGAEAMAAALLARFTQRREDVAEQARAALGTLATLVEQLVARGGELQDDRRRLQLLLRDTGEQVARYSSMTVERDNALAECKVLRAEVEHLESMLQEVRADRGKLRTLAEGATGQARISQAELEKARRQVALQVAEFDALRRDAAAQVASANIQAGELEHQLEQHQAAWQALAELRRAASADMRDVQRLMAAGAGALDRLAARVAHILELSPERKRRETAEPQEEEGDLFEALPSLNGDSHLLIPQSALNSGDESRG